jgi:hypothetical protein
VPNAPDPHSENTSGSNEYLGVLQEDVQEDHCGQEEREVKNAWRQEGKKAKGLRADKKVECEKTRRNISGLKR